MKLTDREMEVWRLMSLGLNTFGIHKALNVGITTVKTYFVNIYDKLGISNKGKYRNLHTTAALMYLSRFNNGNRIREK